MELARDIAVIIFSVSGTIASVVLLVMAIRLYGRAALALENIGNASGSISGSISEVTEVVRSGARLAKDAATVAGAVLPGPRPCFPLLAG